MLSREGDAEAPHVLEGDHVLQMEGDRPSPDWILATAQAQGCDAVYVGYGLFNDKERLELKQKVQTANLFWIGSALPNGDAQQTREMLVNKLEELSLKDFAKVEAKEGKHVSNYRWMEVDVLCQQHPTVETIVLTDREIVFGKDGRRVLVESPAVAPEHFRKGSAIRGAIWEAAQLLAETLALNAYAQLLFAVDVHGHFYFHSFHVGLIAEHVTTEMSTGLDLVEEEMRIAKGEGATPSALHAQPSGHVIQCCVEIAVDPKTKKNYQGKVDDAKFAPLISGKNRIELGVGRGSRIVEGDHPTLVNMAAFGATRHEALLTLDRMIAEMKLTPVVSNIRLLRKAINTETFRVGTYDEKFWDKVMSVEGI